MVFLITSNTTDLDGNGPNITGMNDPARYNNMLSSTFEIEPNSEVAVESIKITRNGNIQLGGANNQFGVYLGADLSACGTTLALSNSAPVMTYIRNGGDVNITKSPKDLCENIRKGLLAGFGQHPNYVPTGDGKMLGPQVELLNGSALFTGFKYTFDQSVSGILTESESSASYYVHADLIRSNTDYTTATQTASGVEINRVVDDGRDSSMIGTEYPLSLADGLVEFNFSGTGYGGGDDWSVGLTRPMLNQYQSVGWNDNADFQYDEDADAWANIGAWRFVGGMDRTEFFDWEVKNVNGSLQVWQTSYTGIDVSGEKFFSKVRVNPSLTQDTKDFDTIQFNLRGDSVRIVALKGSAETLLADTQDGDEATKKNNLKPISLVTRYLHPKVRIGGTGGADVKIWVRKAVGLNINSYNYKTGVNSSYVYGGEHRRYNTPFSVNEGHDGEGKTDNYTYQSFWTHCVETGREGDCFDIEGRDWNDYSRDTDGDIEDTSVYLPMELNASDGVNLKSIIITAPDVLYSDVITREASAQNVMGFENVPTQIVPSHMTTGTSKTTLNSKVVPKMISNKSLFVRLPDLPIESYNTGKGSLSKILYHLPRFDNSGNEVGGLFFAPAQRVYIPLNNPNRLRLNNVKVELCNVDETNNNVDLVGQTIICFDIRKRD